MRGIGTSLEYIVRQNRINAVSRTIVQGGAEGEALAKEAAMMGGEVSQATMELDGEMRVKFILGLHPLDQSGRYVIP